MQLPICTEFKFLQTCMWFVQTSSFACRVFVLSQPKNPFVDPINKQPHGKEGKEEAAGGKCGMHIRKTMVIQCSSPHQTKVNQAKTPRKEGCLQEDAQSRGEHKRAIVLRKGKKKERGRRKRGVKREKAFFGLHCATGGLHAVFTRRLCEFEITRVTETLFHPLFFFF